ncbi:biliverdin-producing heme oxygenase [Pigmentibacter sp. JX0631]|uniref:biliverdin-producing heme oxygenase n=1 Tax=Pigmentibacter sp. JX0631 TaxID=2976982 RepID=UPI002468E088|nr:biliverdin-producing heme oxygenase [Pigmentibacter sp. JX0631]WGL59784.1 biliverdin-producing heme oxygenase [Pigmentibacter sp. JX0631]
MINSELSIRFHELIKLKTKNIHNELDNLIKINSTNEYIDYLIVMYRVMTPLEKDILNFNEFEISFSKTILKNKSNKLILDLKNLDIDIAKINFSKFVPHINCFDEALGCFYVLEGSSLGTQFLFKKLCSLFGENFINNMNYLNGIGRNTFQHWAQFIESLENYTISFPEKKDIILKSAIDTFKCFKLELESKNKQ